jgi:N-acetylglucosamine kinase-like BadF-type ATPase
MDHVLGIDAGGTKTMCLLADETGRIVSEARSGGANLGTAGELAVEKVLHQVMEEAIGDRDIVPAAVCLGMAGVDRPTEGRTVRAIMRRIGAKARVVVVNDALVALVAGAGDSPGVVVISGTGSIIYGRNRENRAARAGGWGYVLGDEGSGYWIGQHALAAVMRASDGRGPQTLLTQKLLGHLGVERARDLVQMVYYREMPLPAIAALGALVEEARQAGDPVATEILERAAQELVLAAKSVVDRLDMSRECFPFVLAGGMFHAIPWLASEAQRRLTGLAPGAVVRRLEVAPAVGAVRLALAELRGGVRLPEYVEDGPLREGEGTRG